jgi:FkbM family methyltransferase
LTLGAQAIDNTLGPNVTVARIVFDDGTQHRLGIDGRRPDGFSDYLVSNSSPQTEDTISISVETLDRVLDSKRPVLIKVDVEGFEDEVVRGGADTLAKESLLGVIMEINGSEQRYGVNAATCGQK